jgi:hypothetical protein
MDRECCFRVDDDGVAGGRRREWFLLRQRLRGFELQLLRLVLLAAWLARPAARVLPQERLLRYLQHLRDFLLRRLRLP